MPLNEHPDPFFFEEIDKLPITEKQLNELGNLLNTVERKVTIEKGLSYPYLALILFRLIFDFSLYYFNLIEEDENESYVPFYLNSLFICFMVFVYPDCAEFIVKHFFKIDSVYLNDEKIDFRQWYVDLPLLNRKMAHEKKIILIETDNGLGIKSGSKTKQLLWYSLPGFAYDGFCFFSGKTNFYSSVGLLLCFNLPIRLMHTLHIAYKNTRADINGAIINNAFQEIFISHSDFSWRNEENCLSVPHTCIVELKSDKRKKHGREFINVSNSKALSILQNIIIHYPKEIPLVYISDTQLILSPDNNLTKADWTNIQEAFLQQIDSYSQVLYLKQNTIRALNYLSRFHNFQYYLKNFCDNNIWQLKAFIKLADIEIVKELLPAIFKGNIEVIDHTYIIDIQEVILEKNLALLLKDKEKTTKSLGKLPLIEESAHTPLPIKIKNKTSKTYSHSSSQQVLEVKPPAKNNLSLFVPTEKRTLAVKISPMLLKAFDTSHKLKSLFPQDEETKMPILFKQLIEGHVKFSVSKSKSSSRGVFFTNKNYKNINGEYAVANLRIKAESNIEVLGHFKQKKSGEKIAIFDGVALKRHSAQSKFVT